MMAASSNGLPMLKRDCTGSVISGNPTSGDTASAGLEEKGLGGVGGGRSRQGRGSQASSLNGIKYICQRTSFNWQTLHGAFCQHNCVYCGYDLFSHS